MRVFDSCSFVVAGMAAILLLGACSSSKAVKAAGSAVKADKERKAAPEFELKDADGKTVRLSDYKGKVVLLDFWATWCPPCLAMLPMLHDLYREWQPRGAEFIGIDSDGPMISKDDLRAFLAERPFPYPVVIDDKEVGGLYGVFSIPHLVVIGRDGRIARVFVGGVSRSQLDAALRAASEGGTQ